MCLGLTAGRVNIRTTLMVDRTNGSIEYHLVHFLVMAERGVRARYI
jgi:hypothetical protein